jgi:hypothetical protein
MRPKTMGTAVIDRLVIVAYGSQPPSDHEWLDYLHLVERQGVAETMHLVSTEGGEPTVAQRGQLNALLARREVPVAVISDSNRVRGSVTLLSLLNRRIRAFRCSRLRDAIDYLEIPASRAEVIERTLRRLRSELDGRDREDVGSR